MNHVHILGRATSDPDFRETSSGNNYARFTIAVDKRLSKVQREANVKEGKATADFIRVVAWSSNARRANRFLRKGARVCVSGSISSDSYEGSDGEKHYFTEVTADDLKLIDMPQLSDVEDDSAEHVKISIVDPE